MTEPPARTDIPGTPQHSSPAPQPPETEPAPTGPDAQQPIGIGPDPITLPPPRWKRRRALLLGGIAAGVVVLALLVSLVGVPVYRKYFVASPTERVLTALQALASAPEVHYTGGVVADDASDYDVRRLDVRIAADGTLHGGVTRAAGHADLIDRDGTLYLRPDHGWMLATSPSEAGFRTGRWQASDSDDMVLATAALRPKKLARYLREGLPDDREGLPDDKEAGGEAGARHHAVPLHGDRAGTIAGRSVAAYRLPAGAIGYVSTDKPYTLLGVDGTLNATDTGYAALDLVAEGNAAGAKLDKTVKARSSDLKADGKRQAPAEYHVVDGSVDAGLCSDHSCTASFKIEASDGDTSRSAALIVLFSSDRAGKHSIGECASTVPTISVRGTVRASCTNRTKAWRRWASRGTAKLWFRGMAVSPGWQGKDSRPMRALYRHVDYRSTPHMFTDVETPVESVKLLNLLLDTHGWSANDAVEAVTAINDANALDPLYSLVGGKHLRLQSKVFGAKFGRKKLPYYQEAARRAKGGSDTLAVVTYEHADTTYQADVFDVSGHQAVWLSTADTEKQPLAKAVLEATHTAHGQPVPAGFGRTVRVVVGPRSGAYRLNRDGLRNLLRAGGVTGAGLAGIARLEVVTGSGAYTFHRSDFQ